MSSPSSSWGRWWWSLSSWPAGPDLLINRVPPDVPDHSGRRANLAALASAGRWLLPLRHRTGHRLAILGVVQLHLNPSAPTVTVRDPPQAQGADVPVGERRLPGGGRLVLDFLPLAPAECQRAGVSYFPPGRDGSVFGAGK